MLFLSYSKDLLKKISRMTLGQFVQKFIRMMGLLAFSFFCKSFLIYFSFSFLLPSKELIDKINLFLCGKMGIVFGAEVFTDFFKGVKKVFHNTFSPLEPLPSISVSSMDSSAQVAAEDCGPSSETKKGFPYKKLLIGGVCLVGLASALFFFFYSGGGCDLSPLETLIQNNNSEQTRLLLECSVKIDVLIRHLDHVRMRQIILDENMRAVMAFLNPNGPAF